MADQKYIFQARLRKKNSPRSRISYTFRDSYSLKELRLNWINVISKALIKSAPKIDWSEWTFELQTKDRHIICKASVTDLASNTDDADMNIFYRADSGIISNYVDCVIEDIIQNDC